MRHWTPQFGLVVAGMSLFALGCEQPIDSELPPGEEPAPLVEGDDAAPDFDKHPADQRDKFARMGKGGPGAMLIHEALHTLELTDAQREKLEALADGCKPSDQDKSAHTAFRTTLAAGVRAGALDDAAIQRHLTAFDEKGALRRDKMLAHLDTLHATLTPEQRRALVDGLRAKAERFEGKSFDGGEHARQGKPEKMGKRGKTRKGMDKGMFAMMRGLDLSEEQQSELHEVMRPEAKPEEMRARFTKMRQTMKAMMTAFARDDFDASSFAPPEDAPTMRKMMDRKVEMVRRLIPILDEDQREILATNLEKDWTANRRGKVGGKVGKRGLRRDPGREVQ